MVVCGKCTVVFLWGYIWVVGCRIRAMWWWVVLVVFLWEFDVVVCRRAGITVQRLVIIMDSVQTYIGSSPTFSCRSNAFHKGWWHSFSWWILLHCLPSPTSRDLLLLIKLVKQSEINTGRIIECRVYQHTLYRTVFY